MFESKTLHLHWNFRLQMLWILFSAVYLTLGKFVASEVEELILREISSIMMTLGGTLITLLIYHTLLESDHTKYQPTFLIALTASIFLCIESYSVYKDELGSLFSGMFSLLCILLIWMYDSQKRLSLKYVSAWTMTIVIGCSLICLVHTKLSFHIVEYYELPNEINVFGTQGPGILMAFFFAIFWRHHLPSTTSIFFTVKKPKKIWKLFEFAVFLGISMAVGKITGVNSAMKIGLTTDSAQIISFSYAIYNLVFTFICGYCIFSDKKAFIKYRITICVVFAILLSSVYELIFNYVVFGLNYNLFFLKLLTHDLSYLLLLLFVFQKSTWLNRKIIAQIEATHKKFHSSFRTQ